MSGSAFQHKAYCCLTIEITDQSEVMFTSLQTETNAQSKLPLFHSYFTSGVMVAPL